MLYAYAVAVRARQSGLSQHERIPLPGLAQPESQLGIPLLVRGELVGVLCIESEEPYRFHEEDKASIELLGSYLAIAIQNMQLLEREESAAETAAEPPAAAPLASAAPTSTRTRHEVAFYEADEIVMVDGDYLIRSLPARILWKLLTLHGAQGRTEFTNRELRLDKTLNLPDLKDNLESRLLLLRRRLEQKCPDIRLVPTARGRFSLDLAAELRLVSRP